jgi:hypothetical protein
MSRLRYSARICALFLMLFLLIWQDQVIGRAPDTLPAALSNAEFWALSERISEPDGFFRSNSGSTDNLLSNESSVSRVATELSERVKPSGVYLGVGPEQNFSYIAAIRPRIAFITDIRRGNLDLQLTYKALFELSENRADFVARLFNRKRPAGLTTASSATELMAAYLRVNSGDEAAFSANLKAIIDHLTKVRGLPLSADDLAGIEYVYRSFYRFGPGINYTSSIGRPGGGITYAALMSSRDARGVERSYLASEGNFAFVKTMQTKNLIVPIVGDFAGPKALREIGAFLRDRGAVVTAFYVSNVENYLRNNGVWPKFCANVATLPADTTSTFIRPEPAQSVTFGSIVRETAACGAK